MSVARFLPDGVQAGDRLIQDDVAVDLQPDDTVLHLAELRRPDPMPPGDLQSALFIPHFHDDPGLLREQAVIQALAGKPHVPAFFAGESHLEQGHYQAAIADVMA